MAADRAEVLYGDEMIMRDKQNIIMSSIPQTQNALIDALVKEMNFFS